MVKRLLLVSLLTSACFGDMVKIDLPVPQDGWNHENANLIRVNLDSFINSGEQITSAKLELTGLQNTMEPESNDILHMSLLQLNYAGRANVELVTAYEDKQAEGNYFKNNLDRRYTWVEGKSDLGFYTDNNDDVSKVVYFNTGSYFEDSHEHARLIADGYILAYRGGSGNFHEWSKVKKSDLTFEDYSVDINVENLTTLKTAGNGWIGLGFDADCHYLNSKATLYIETTPTTVPEPTSMSFLLVGLASLTGFGFSRKRK